MASQSLYRKWRSQTFSDLIGQEATTRTLLNAVRDGRLAHAYLFCGPRGTGKTSAARLLAKAINCANPHDGEPCNECLSCREITAGQSPDVIEIDAASNTGVENIRELRQNVNLLGIGGHFKVYVVDEVHMLSTAAFNALLKTLEEPPPHVIFVLATTEAHKVLPTIVSRCQRFDFRRISMRDIVARLRHVAQGEGLELEPAAADLLARAAQGGMRDALSLLDQAIAYCGAHVDLERTRTMLGLADPGAMRQLIVAVAEQRAADALHQLNELVVTGADLRQLQQQLGEEWRALLLARAGADVGEVMDRTRDEARELGALASHFSLEELMACARIFARSETPARGLPVPQLALELALLECLTIRRTGGALIVSQPTATAAMGPATGPTTASVPVSAPGAIGHPATAQPISPAPEESIRQPEESGAGPSEPPSLREDEAMRSRQAREASEPVASQPTAGELAQSETPMATPPAKLHAVRRDEADEPADEEAAAEEAERVTSVTQSGASAGTLQSAPAATNGSNGINWLAQAQREWSVIQKVCKQRSQKIAALLHHAKPVGMQQGDPPVIVVQVLHEFHFRNLKAPEHKQMVEWAMEQVLGTPVRLSLTMGDPEGDGGQAGGQRTTGSAVQRPPSGANGHNGRDGNGAYNGSNAAPAANGFHTGAPPAPTKLGAEDAMPAEATPAQTPNGNGRAVTSHGQSMSPSMADNAPDSAAVGGNGHQPKAQSNGRAKNGRAPSLDASSLDQEAQGDAIVQEVERELGIQLVEVVPVDEDDEPF